MILLILKAVLALGGLGSWRLARHRKLSRPPQFTSTALGDSADRCRELECFAKSRHVSWRDAVLLLLGFVIGGHRRLFSALQHCDIIIRRAQFPSRHVKV